MGHGAVEGEFENGAADAQLCAGLIARQHGTCGTDQAVAGFPLTWLCLPLYARPPLVYLNYVALGSGQDFGHGSAGAIILTLIIAIVAVVQGRVMGLGRDRD